MLFLKKLCALFLLVFFLSGLATAVLASGKSCENSNLVSDSNKNGCPNYVKADGTVETEQCCCCKADQSCAGVAGEKGVCFSREVIIGRKLVGGKEVLDPRGVTCGGVVCPFSTHTSVQEFIMAAVNYIFYLSLILAPLMIIIGAALFLTSAGSPKQTKLASAVIQWTLIGFAIILFARGISAIITMILVG